MKYRGIFEYEYPTEHKPPVSIDVHLHGDCVKGKIIEWEYRPLEQEPRWIPVSEKLPEPFTFVNATCRSLIDDREDWVVETVYLPIPKEANKHGYSDWGNIPMLNWGGAEVIAWVERIIPQPYREVEV